ncbi:zinc finger BED domain-containing protein 1-like isoform X1 [Acanthaster planci]|uniref:Zinc finger BED domain-containing protein 1-like isoform X1 n=1 Tax=Acanthaster planci TaxID=133434 RepID=A0A8B7YM56_ACAPL|nr:zinc finger BED domain-containing protein 1-like isoform X1 [Acanthaster planci]
MPRGKIAQKVTVPKNLLVRKNFSSPIWKYFGFPTNPNDPSEPANEDEIVCALCNKSLSYNKSTTVMHKHLKGRHPNVFETLASTTPDKTLAKGKVGRPSGRRSSSLSSASRIQFGEGLKKANVVPKRSSSWVWNYFFFPQDPATQQPIKEFVTCALCEKKITYHGGTSPMRNHIRMVHKSEFAEHNQWEVVEVSQDMLNINAADPKVRHQEQQLETEEVNLSSLCEEDIYSDDLLQKKGLLHKKGACSSPIWRFFGFLPDPDDPAEAESPDKVVCALCGKQLMYANSSTTIMRNHLDHKHPKVYISQIPRTVAASTSAEAPKRSGSSMMNNRKKRLSTCIANYIAKDLKPLSSLEEPSFRKMLHEFDPRFVLPSREDFTQRIMPRLYDQVKNLTVLPALKNAKHVALSIDMWGRSSVDQYMTVTAHLLTSDWELKSFMLENVQFPLPHDASHIADCLNKVAADWTISEDPMKISALVTNNAVKNSFTGKHVPCLGHTLNTIVKAGLQCPGVQGPLGCCIKLIEFLHSAPITVDTSLAQQPSESQVVSQDVDVPSATQVGTEDVDISQHYETHQQLDVQGQLDVLERLVTAAQINVEDQADISALTTIQQVEARPVVQAEEPLTITMQDMSVPLGTTHSMLRGILDKRELLKTVLVAAEKTELVLSEADIKIVEEIEKVLAPLQTLAETILGRSYATASGLLPSVYYLKAVLKSKDDDLPEIIEMKQAMAKELASVYEDPSLSIILPRATFLDARYKKLPFFSEEQRVAIQEEIAKEIMLLTDNKVMEDAAHEEPPEKKPMHAWASLLGDMFDEEGVEVKESEPIGGAKDEIRRYLTEPRLGLEADPLKWWQQNGPRYPLLSAVAMKYLCIPSTSVPSEHLFSTAGIAIAAKRSLLDAKDVQLLPFLNANLQ